ncbi:MAG: hypothetical protein K5906_05085 [Bacilli bacterium]|nr:hypothetical protein [Bacilli bacterium]
METRIQRHRKYRAELIKEGSDVTIKEKNMTTTALPIKEVITMVEDDKNTLSFYRKQRNERIIRYILLSLLLASIIVGIIMFGVYAFGG